MSVTLIVHGSSSFSWLLVNRFYCIFVDSMRWKNLKKYVYMKICSCPSDFWRSQKYFLNYVILIFSLFVSTFFFQILFSESRKFVRFPTTKNDRQCLVCTDVCSVWKFYNTWRLFGSGFHGTFVVSWSRKRENCDQASFMRRTRTRRWFSSGRSLEGWGLHLQFLSWKNCDVSPLERPSRNCEVCDEGRFERRLEIRVLNFKLNLVKMNVTIKVGFLTIFCHFVIWTVFLNRTKIVLYYLQGFTLENPTVVRLVVYTTALLLPNLLKNHLLMVLVPPAFLLQCVLPTGMV